MVFGKSVANEPCLTGFLAKAHFVPHGSDSSPRAGSGFDQFMTDIETGRRETVRDSRTDVGGRERRSNDRPAGQESSRTEEASRRRSYENAAGRAEADQCSEILCGVVECEAEIQEAVLCNLAAAVQIPPELLYELLSELDILPEELTEPVKANKLLQSLLQVESPVEMLNMPEYPDVLKEVTEAVAEILKTAGAKPNLDRLAGLVAEVDYEDRLIISKEPEQVLTVEGSPRMLERGSQDSSGGEQEGFQESRGYYDEKAPIISEQHHVVPKEVQEINSVQPVLPAAVMAAQQAAAVHAAVEATATTRIDPTQVMEQIISKVKTVSAENFAELRITLRPEHLGDVSLRIAVQSGVVLAMFVAENQRIKEIIESNFNLLRDALAEQGIEVGELFVSVNGGDAEDQMRQMDQMLKAHQEAMRRLQRASGLVGDVEESEETNIVDPSVVYNNTVDYSA